MSRFPTYALYGHQAQPAWLDMVHFERIHVRSAMHDFDIAPHVHDGLIQILHVTSGGGSVFIDGRSWPLAAPSLIVVPARHVHGFRFTPDIDGPVVTAAQRPLESLVQVGAPELMVHVRTPRVLPVPPSARHAEALGPLFEAIERESRMHAGSEVAAGAALLMAVFVQIARIAAQEPAADAAGAAMRSRQAGQVERLRALVDQHFRERLPIEAYAARLGVSPGQLTRLTRRMLGVTCLDLVNARVVHEAERELVYSNLSVKQVAAVLGFADEAYFGRFFKKHTGRTPSEFRDRAREHLGPSVTTATAAGPAGGPAASPAVVPPAPAAPPRAEAPASRQPPPLARRRAA